MNKHVSALMQKEMSRKEFLATLGFGAVTLMGFGTVLKFLRGDATFGNSTRNVSNGYGSSSYGK